MRTMQFRTTIRTRRAAIRGVSRHKCHSHKGFRVMAWILCKTMLMEQQGLPICNNLCLLSNKTNFSIRTFEKVEPLGNRGRKACTQTHQQSGLKSLFHQRSKGNSDSKWFSLKRRRSERLNASSTRSRTTQFRSLTLNTRPLIKLIIFPGFNRKSLCSSTLISLKIQKWMKDQGFKPNLSKKRSQGMNQQAFQSTLR